MKRPRERFLVPAHGPDVDAVRVAVSALELLCEKHEGDALICVPALKNAESTVLNRVWPERQIKQLAQGRALKLGKHHVRMCSPFTLKSQRGAPVVLGLFASKDMIDKLEASPWGHALIVLPWIPEDKDAWETQHNPKVLTVRK